MLTWAALAPRWAITLLDANGENIMNIAIVATVVALALLPSPLSAASFQNRDADEAVTHLILGFEEGDKVDIRSPQFTGVRIARKVSEKPLALAVDENGIAKDGSHRSRQISSLSVTKLDNCTFRVRVQIFDNPNLGAETATINEKTGQSSNDSVYQFDFSGLTAVTIRPIFDGVAEEVRFEGMWTRSRDFLLPYPYTDEAKISRQKNAQEALVYFREHICKPKD